MKEYGIAKGWVIFIYAITILSVGLFCYFLIPAIINGKITSTAVWILSAVFLAWIILLILGILDWHKSKVVINENSITAINLLSTRELKIDEIKGFVINDQAIFIEPYNPDKKIVKISKYIHGYGEILRWVSERCKNLEEEIFLKEEEEILNNDDFGWTRDAREEKLSTARRTAKTVTWLSCLIAAWVLFYPKQYNICMLAAILTPIIAIFIAKTSGGLIKFDEKKGSAYPTIMYAFLFPTLALSWRSLLDFEILNYEKLWLPSSIIAGSLLLIILLKQSDFKFKKVVDFLTLACYGLFFFVFGLGTILHYNCYYDDSDTQFYTSEVLDKRVRSGKSTSYKLELSKWGPQKEIEEVNVDQTLYKRTKIGDSMNIYFQKGKLDIPWYIVSDD